MRGVTLHYYTSWSQPKIHILEEATTTASFTSIIHPGRSPHEKVFRIELPAGTRFFLSYHQHTDRPDWGPFYTVPEVSSALVDGEFYPLPYHHAQSFRVDWSEISEHFEYPFFVRFFAPRLQENPLPLLLLNDGQNQWKNHGYWEGWHSDETALQLIRRGQIQPFYLLAIDHPPSRHEIYLPTHHAQQYIDFLAEDLIPKLRKRYHISTVSIAGSSYGGVNALYAGLKRPETFSQVACLSYAWFSRDPIPDILAQEPLKIKKLYLDSGTRWTEDPGDLRHDYQDITRNLAQIIHHKNPDLPLKYNIVEGHAHNERFWRARFPNVLQFLFSYDSLSELQEVSHRSSSS